MDILFMTMAGAGIFILRKKRPDAERPYRTAGYPYVPLIFVLISGAFVLSTLVERPIQTLAGLGLVALGIAAFLLFRRKNLNPG
jgi:APA family basic amino acid/polyamine antiporter